MKNSKIGSSVYHELENAISQSCKSSRTTKQHEELHKALLKKYYNATDVAIDYHRQRIKMNIVMDESRYSPGKVNTNLPLLPTNLIYDNLRTFLKSCIDTDKRSLGFYAQLLRAFTTKEQVRVLV